MGGIIAAPIMLTVFTKLKEVALYRDGCNSRMVEKINTNALEKKPNKNKKINNSINVKCGIYSMMLMLRRVPSVPINIGDLRRFNRSDKKPNVGQPTAQPIKIKEVMNAARCLEML